MKKTVFEKAKYDSKESFEDEKKNWKTLLTYWGLGYMIRFFEYLNYTDMYTWDEIDDQTILTKKDEHGHGLMDTLPPNEKIQLTYILIFEQY